MNKGNYMRIAFLFLFPILALADDDSSHSANLGNGGDVVVCRNVADGTVRIELLDSYEARALRGLSIVFENPGADYIEQIRVLAARLEILSPDRARRFVVAAERFSDDANFISGITLTDVPDWSYIPIPSGCRLAQAAVYRNRQFPEDKEFLVNRDLWDQLDNPTRAQLVLHLLVLREHASVENPSEENAFRNAIPVRKFIGSLAANAFGRMGFPDFVRWMRATGFGDLSIQYRDWLVHIGTELYPNGIEFYPSGVVAKLGLVGRQEVRVGALAFSVDGTLLFSADGALRGMRDIRDAQTTLEYANHSLRYLSYTQIDFFPDGGLEYIAWVTGVLRGTHFELALPPGGNGSSVLRFFPNGQVRSLMGWGKTRGVAAINREVEANVFLDYGNNVENFGFSDAGYLTRGMLESPPSLTLAGCAFVANGEFTAYDSGELRSAYAAGDAVLNAVDGTAITVRTGELVHFSPLGLVLPWIPSAPVRDESPPPR